eukprot:1139074-Pelagomonas_calceolata.AAC.1
MGNGCCRACSSVHLRFVSACRHHAVAACSSERQPQHRGGWVRASRGCGMQLVLWRGACMGHWWSGVGSDEGGPGIEQRHG